MTENPTPSEIAGEEAVARLWPSACGSWSSYEHADYENAMAELHGLTPDDSIPLTPRQFAGETDGEYSPPTWCDRLRGWRDREGNAVLTAEPYDHIRAHDNAMILLADLEELPLTLEVRAGVWDERTVLLVMRRSSNYEQLPSNPPFALAPPMMSVEHFVELWVLHRHAQGLRAPTQQSVTGLVDKVISAGESERLGLLVWAVSKLIGCAIVPPGDPAHLPCHTVERLIAATIEAGQIATDVPTALSVGWSRFRDAAWRSFAEERATGLELEAEVPAAVCAYFEGVCSDDTV